MERENIRFITAIIIGFLVMLIFGIFTVNILQFVPLIGPFIGGIVAGLIAGKNCLDAGKAAMIAGLLGAGGVGLDLVANTSYLRMAVPQLPQFAGFLFFIVAIFYFPILAFIGGVLGGMIGQRAKSCMIPEKSK